MLFNEPKLLKCGRVIDITACSARVSVLFNEPKLLKCHLHNYDYDTDGGFSALQRAEIAEMRDVGMGRGVADSFSALQRAEIAEIRAVREDQRRVDEVSVLFNEPKLLKSVKIDNVELTRPRFQCSSTSRNC